MDSQHYDYFNDDDDVNDDDDDDDYDNNSADVDDDDVDGVAESYILSGLWNLVTHQLSALLCLASNRVRFFTFLDILNKQFFF